MHIFSHKKTILSEDQLKKDFGEFPPLPLACESAPQTSFTIINVSRIGYVIHYFKVLVRMLKAPPSPIVSELKSEREFYSELTDQYFEVRELLDDTNLIKRIVKIFFLALFLPVILVISAFIILRLVLRTGSRAYASSKTKGGAFYFQESGALEILILRSNIIGREDAIISHEHIHALQYCNRSTNTKCPEAENLDLIVREEYCNDPLAMYLFEQREVEARLHELVLSFYRQHSQLPITSEGILDMLACSNLKAFWDADEVISPTYAIRDENTGQDINAIFLLMKDDAARTKFTYEVLVYMYSNLLEYYGDLDASSSIRAEIKNQGLYNKLYGTTL